jgi:hypothetical protein
MPTLTIEYRDETERLALEQAIAFFTHLRQVAQTAPAGTILTACEQVALHDGRKLLRDSLSAAVQARIDDAEQKGGTSATVCAPVAPPGRRGGVVAARS